MQSKIQRKCYVWSKVTIYKANYKENAKGFWGKCKAKYKGNANDFWRKYKAKYNGNAKDFYVNTKKNTKEMLLDS